MIRPMSPIERHAVVRGRPIRYLDAGSGAPALFIHGFPLSADMWVPQMASVPPGWRFIAPDLRGFRGAAGASGPVADPGRVTMDDYAGDLIGLLDHLGIRAAVVAGLSMGGYVAFALLRRAHAFARGLVLADTRPQADSDAGREARLAMLELLGREGPAGVARQMLPTLVSETTRREHPAIELRLHALIEANTAAGLRSAIGAMLARPDSTPQLGAIGVPTLILVGEQDALTPLDDSARMHELISGAQLTVIPRAGHLSNLEQPQAFNAALAQFLSRSL
jgi:pimeloyl-ACP methyl ester carboxylesterase